MSRKLTLSVLFVAAIVNATAIFAESLPPLPVYVSILPQKYFVERIGGDLVTVSVMVGPGKSPATYEPTPKQMERLTAARLYFRIGVPFEKIWLPRLKANHPHLRLVDTLEGIQLLAMAPHGHDEQKDTGKTLHRGKSTEQMKRLDPHVWTSPPRVKIMAGTIFQSLLKELPAHKAELTANYQSFLADMDRLTKDIQQRLEPIRNRRFLVFHPSWGYFAETFDLQQIAIEAEGKEPGARTLTKLIEQAKTHDIRVLFVQKQFSSVAARMVSEAIGGEVVAVDPLAENYSENLRLVAEAFAKGMTP